MPRDRTEYNKTATANRIAKYGIEAERERERLKKAAQRARRKAAQAPRVLPPAPAPAPVPAAEVPRRVPPPVPPKPPGGVQRLPPKNVPRGPPPPIPPKPVKKAPPVPDTLSTTQQTNIKRINRLREYMEIPYNESSPYQFLGRMKEVIHAIDTNPSWKSAETKRSIFAAIASELKKYPEVKQIYEKYSAIVSERSTELQDKAKENKVKLRENIGEWKRLLSLKNGTLFKEDTYENQFLYALYTEIPTRRIQDYSRLQMWRRDEPPPNDKGNYVVVPKEGNPYLIISTYKTASTYDKMRLPLEGEAIRIAKKLSNTYTSSEYIFPYYRTYEMTEEEALKLDKKVSEKVGKIFSSYLGEKITLNDIRKIYVNTWIDDPSMSEKDKEQRAIEMGSALETLRQYYRKIPEKKKEIKDTRGFVYNPPREDDDDEDEE
jgi:hypothetical protein